MKDIKMKDIRFKGKKMTKQDVQSLSDNMASSLMSLIKENMTQEDIDAVNESKYIKNENNDYDTSDIVNKIDIKEMIELIGISAKIINREI